MDFLHPVQAVIPGTQGRVLAVLAETSAELNLRTVARLASVSLAQTSRVLPGLVELGLVDRREVPPSSLFRLNRENVAAQVVIELARSHDTALERMGTAARELPIPPGSVIVFGSFARREADSESDIDAVIVRPDDIDDDDDMWAAGVEEWRRSARAITGNPVEVIEIGRAAASEKLSGRSQLWRDVARDGVVVQGATLDELRRRGPCLSRCGRGQITLPIGPRAAAACRTAPPAGSEERHENVSSATRPASSSILGPSAATNTPSWVPLGSRR